MIFNKIIQEYMEPLSYSSDDQLCEDEEPLVMAASHNYINKVIMRVWKDFKIRFIDTVQHALETMDNKESFIILKCQIPELLAKLIGTE